MEIIEEEEESYELWYDDALFPGCGYAFPCDKNGAILWDECTDLEATRKSLAYCKEHPDEWTPSTRDGRVVKIIHRVRYGICPICGRKIYFGGSGWSADLGLVECECGQWYNVFGEMIKPPEDWEEDFFSNIWP